MSFQSNEVYVSYHRPILLAGMQYVKLKYIVNGQLEQWPWQIDDFITFRLHDLIDFFVTAHTFDPGSREPSVPDPSNADEGTIGREQFA